MQFNSLKIIKTIKQEYLALIVFAALVFAFYGSALFNGFVYDDVQQVVENKYIQSFRYLPKVVTGCVWEYAFEGCKDRAIYYRPVQSLSYLLTYQISSSPWIFHLVNLIYFLVIVYLIFFLLKILTKNFIFAFFAALIFLVHPINNEVVNWVAAVPELTSAIFILLAIIFYIQYLQGRHSAAPQANSQKSPTDRKSRRRRDDRLKNIQGLMPSNKKFLFVSVFYFLAILSKESAIFLPVIFIPVDMLFAGVKIKEFFQWRNLKTYILFFPPLIVYLLMRITVLGGWFVQQGATPHGSFSIAERLFEFLTLFFRYIGKFFYPNPLSFFYSFEKKSDFLSIEFLLALATFALFIAAIIFFFKRLKYFLVFSLIWIIIFILPALLFLSSLGEAVFSERYLFIPGIGFAVALGYLFNYLWQKQEFRVGIFSVAMSRNFLRGGVIAIVSCIVVVSFALTWQRNSVWKNNESLYTKTLSQNPKAYPIRFNFAVFLRNEKRDFEAAKIEFEKIIDQNSRWGDINMVYMHLGDYYRDVKKDEQKALNYYLMSATSAGNTWKGYFAHDRAGGIFAAKGDYLRAILAFCRAVQINPDAEESQQRFAIVSDLIRTAYATNPESLYKGVAKEGIFLSSELKKIQYVERFCDKDNCSFIFAPQFGASEVILPFLITASDDKGKAVEILDSAFNPARGQIMLKTDPKYKDEKIKFIFPTCEGKYYEAAAS